MTQLVGESLYLRKVEPEDLEFLYTIENNPDFWFVSETTAPYSRWDLKQYIENSAYDIFTTKELRLMICDKIDGKTLGIVDLFDYHPLHNRCGVGIIISPDFMHQSIASQTIEIIKEYAFNTLLVNQLWCMIDADNSNSISLFEKSGFVRTGILQQWKRRAEKYSDVLVYQYIK